MPRPPWFKDLTVKIRTKKVPIADNNPVIVCFACGESIVSPSPLAGEKREEWLKPLALGLRVKIGAQRYMVNREDELVCEECAQAPYRALYDEEPTAVGKMYYNEDCYPVAELAKETPVWKPRPCAWFSGKLRRQIEVTAPESNITAEARKVHDHGNRKGHEILGDWFRGRVLQRTLKCGLCQKEVTITENVQGKYFISSDFFTEPCPGKANS